MVNTTADETWGKLADEPEEARESAMLTRYNELATMAEEQRRTLLRPMATAEYALADDKLRSFTLSRLRTLLRMDREQARTLIQSYDAVMQQMPANAAMRRVSLVQSLIGDFTTEEEAQLRELIPSVFAGAVRRVTPEELEAATAARQAQVQTQRKQKPWWAFWQR